MLNNLKLVRFLVSVKNQTTDVFYSKLYGLFEGDMFKKNKYFKLILYLKSSILYVTIIINNKITKLVTQWFTKQIVFILKLIKNFKSIIKFIDLNVYLKTFISLKYLTDDKITNAHVKIIFNKSKS